MRLPCQDWWSLKITKCIFLFSYLNMYCHLDRKKLSTKQLEIHTSYNSSCKWTKSLDIDIFDLKIKRRLEFSILKFTDSLLSCCCPVQKYPPRMAKLAWQLSSYLWRGSMNFKIKSSRPLFTKMAMSRLTVAPLSTRMPSLYLFRS